MFYKTGQVVFINVWFYLSYCIFIFIRFSMFEGFHTVRVRVLRQSKETWVHGWKCWAM